ncbi:MAG: ABC transporter ATP-binding protein [Chitinophagaceae bacterium]|nr:ABC transporter ATP-binding protein [Chitinophagaceae bacterium]
MAFLDVRGISKKGSDSFSVHNITFSQHLFQNIAIAGETGSGKTTLLKLIAGLVQPTEGEILFESKKVIGPDDQLLPGHPAIAYLSQHFELRNNYWVHELLEMANKLDEKEARKIFKICQVEHLLHRRTDQLSGGERQRIALARVLITSPKLLLLDEPYSNLDAIHKNIIKSVIYEIGAKLSLSCILVSHDAPDILSWADSILVMKDGEIIQTGTPAQIYDQPINEYCAGLFGEYNLINKDLAQKIVGKDFYLPENKLLLVRPESFLIGTATENMVTGKVQTVLYWGSYYTVDVQTARQLIRVRTNKKEWKTGDTVNLSLSAENIWYM